MAQSKKQKEQQEVSIIVERLKNHSTEYLMKLKDMWGRPLSETFKKAVNQILKSRGAEN